MGHFATGVTVVTSRDDDGAPCGLTANSLASVSLRPRLVLVCIDKSANSHDCVIGHGSFAVNVLEESDASLARRFSTAATGCKFDGVGYSFEETGSPVLERALAWLDCALWRAIDAGDHTIVVGEVLACDARAGRPLVFYRGRYGGIAE